VGFLRAGNRPLIRAICRHFGYRDTPVRAVLPRVEISDVVSEDTAIQVREPVGTEGNISLLELVLLAKLLRSCRPRAVFEIGTFDGRTTLNLAANCPGDAWVYTLDLPRGAMGSTRLPLEPGERSFIDKAASGARYVGTDCEKKIVQLYGDSAAFDFSPFVDRMDFVFVDGSHSYEYVLQDSRQAVGLLRGGRGMVVWHDYDGWEGVTRALNDLYAAGGEFKGLRHIGGTSLACLLL